MWCSDPDIMKKGVSPPLGFSLISTEYLNFSQFSHFTILVISAGSCIFALS
ncbi:hypothetical protein D1AOALGA4SA_3075 [Olavius algarvensis Delta 1 endosymbiont]|nr:hypothetical protein D1AOALGA4SA_3075 [Olavius algarvensis Delta 1 endosymbiont]